jgi:hypothetical protein
VTERCEDLDLFFDRELEPEAEQAYRDHLATCTRCQEVLLGRMLEAAVVGEDRDSRPSIDPIPIMGADGAAPPPERPAEPPPAPPTQPPDEPVLWQPWRTGSTRRRMLMVAAAVLPAAAVAVLVLRPPGAKPPATSDVAIQLAPERFVDVRFTAAELDHYRKPSVMRAVGGAPADRTERISLEALGALNQRAERNALVGAFALNGDMASAERAAGELSRSAASLADRAAVVLLAAHSAGDPALGIHPDGSPSAGLAPSPAQVAAAETAVSLTSDALRLDPRSAQAKWNQAIALRRLGLSLTAARVFDDLAASGEVGWSDEARDSAQRLRRDHREAVDDWQQVQAAASAVVAGGPVPGDEDVRRAPSLWRDQFYVALAAASTADRIAALMPLARALDAQFATTALGDLLAQVRASDLRARAPVAAELHDFLADPGAQLARLSGVRDHALQRGAPDIARAIFLLVPERFTDDADLAMLDRLLAGNHDGWWQLVALARRAYVAEFRHRDYPAVDAIERLAEPLCKTDRNAWCGRITLLAGGASSQMGRADLAIEQLTAARYRTGATPTDEFDAIDQLGQAIAMQVTDAIDSAAIAGAYLEEVALRKVTCKAELQRLDFAAMAALQHHRVDEAARFRDQADGLEQGKCRDQAIRLNGEMVRLRLVLEGRGSVATLRNKLSQIRAEGWKNARGYVDFLDAAATLVEDRSRGEAALRQVLTRVTADSSQSFAGQVRAGAYDALVESAATSHDADAVLALLGERLEAPRLDRCVLGVASWNRLIVAVRGADGQAVVDSPAIGPGTVMVPPPAVVAPALRARLAGCHRVEVLAPAPYFGVPRLLDDRVAWVYRSGTLRAGTLRAPHEPTSQHDHEIVVSDVTPPEDLHLPALHPFSAGPAAEILSGPRATPASVLAAMATANLAVVVAHGVTHAEEPSAASLILSPDAHGDYLLTAAKVRAARFSGAPVVVLAGCYAGRVQVSAEPWSLATSFIEAGARVVIAPTEPIPDASATRVFQSLVEQIRAGVDPVDAVVAERTAPGTAAAWLSSIVIFD